MIQLSAEAHAWIKALHIIAVIAWLAGLLYLPRLFVYHASAVPGSDKSETFKVMERRLLYAIMTPAMVAAFILGGILLAALSASDFQNLWIHVKLVLVVLLAAMHGLMARWRRDFANDRNRRPAALYRAANEIPTVLMVAIVILAVVRPF
jgi:putative membrane protein